MNCRAMPDTLKPRDAKEVEDAVRWALGSEKPLEIAGQGTKRMIGRPIMRLVPCPAISSGFSLPSAQRTASSTSLASRGLSVSGIARQFIPPRGRRAHGRTQA